MQLIEALAKLNGNSGPQLGNYNEIKRSDLLNQDQGNNKSTPADLKNELKKSQSQTPKNLTVKIVRKERIIPLAALAIALFMTLPRILIIAYFKTNPDPRMSDITWSDLLSKCFYTFIVAWGFLWFNVRETDASTVHKIFKMNRFTHRLVMNLIFLILIKSFFKLLGIPAVSELRPGKGSIFLFNISLVLEVVFCILIGEIYRLFKSNQQQRLSNEMLLKLNAEATFEILKNQVNPHFLFNSLNTINAIIDSDVNAAKRFVNNMSQVYRHVLNSAGKSTITLAEELKFTNAYISMLQERHANSLFIEVQIPDGQRSLLLPPVSLQILIENAVKHNVVSINQPLTVTITERAGYLVVANKMNKRKQRLLSTGTGLLNLNQRYQHLCGRTIEVSNSEDIFTVAIPLLKKSGDIYILT